MNRQVSIPLLILSAIAAVVLMASLALARSSPHPYGVATAYCQGTTTSSGTAVREGVAASVTLRPGTKVQLIGHQAFLHGRRRFRVEDTGALASNQLDLYTPDCGAALNWGRRKIHYKIGWSK